MREEKTERYVWRFDTEEWFDIETDDDSVGIFISLDSQSISLDTTEFAKLETAVQTIRKKLDELIK